MATKLPVFHLFSPAWRSPDIWEFGGVFRKALGSDWIPDMQRGGKKSSKNSFPSLQMIYRLFHPPERQLWLASLLGEAHMSGVSRSNTLQMFAAAVKLYDPSSIIFSGWAGFWVQLLWGGVVGSGKVSSVSLAGWRVVFTLRDAQWFWFNLYFQSSRFSHFHQTK